MSDTGNQTSSTTIHSESHHHTPAKVKKEKKVKNPRTKPSHPPTSEMVNNAIKGLKERGGSSLQAIKKYVAANYKVDAEKVAPFIKKYLKTAVQGGSLVQTKGKGASGSFKLASGSTSGGKPSSGSEKKRSAVKSKKTSAAKKAVAGDKPKSAAKRSTKAKKEKKAVAPKVKKAAASGEKKPAAAKAKSPSKAKKSKAGAIKKPKAPKPKTAKAVQSKGGKKPVSPKKKK